MNDRRFSSTLEDENGQVSEIPQDTVLTSVD